MQRDATFDLDMFVEELAVEVSPCLLEFAKDIGPDDDIDATFEGFFEVEFGEFGEGGDFADFAGDDGFFANLKAGFVGGHQAFVSGFA